MLLRRCFYLVTRVGACPNDPGRSRVRLLMEGSDALFRPTGTIQVRSPALMHCTALPDLGRRSWLSAGCVQPVLCSDAAGTAWLLCCPAASE